MAHGLPKKKKIMAHNLARWAFDCNTDGPITMITIQIDGCEDLGQPIFCILDFVLLSS